MWGRKRLTSRVRELAAFLAPEATNRSTLTEQLAIATMMAPKFTIQGGATEVLRGIIARGLGLRWRLTERMRSVHSRSRRSSSVWLP